MTCFDSQVIQRLTAIQLDECGRIPTTGTPALKGLEKALTTFDIGRSLDTPATNTVKRIDGGTCTKPRAAPTDNGFTYAITFCGANPIFEVITGYKKLDLSGSTITGWEDVELTGTPKVALEVIFAPSADACEVGETPKCRAVLIPLVEQWVRSSNETFNGTDVPDLAMSGSTALSKNLFGNYADDTEVPAWFAHWAPKYDRLAANNPAWQYTALIDCPTVDETTDACTLVAL